MELCVIKPAYHTLSPMAIVIVVLVIYHFSIAAVQACNIECEELAVEDCAFAVASSGARCVLEKLYQTKNGKIQYKCQTSIIMAERGAVEWIETDACIGACGLTRMWVGLSTDALLERHFVHGLCSIPCRSQCPNIMDLFTNLAIEEGVYLPNLCDSLGAMEPHENQVMETTTRVATSRRELREGKKSTTLESLQDMNGGFPMEPPFDAGAPHPREPWGTHVEPPYPFKFPHAEPPYPYEHMEPPNPYEHVEPPNPYDRVEPPYPYEPPNPYEPLESPYPYDHVEPPYPYDHVEPPYPQEVPPFIFGEPPYPQAPYVPPYFIEPPSYQEPPNNNYGEPPFPDFSSESPIYTQPEPFLVAPNLPPSSFNDGF